MSSQANPNPQHEPTMEEILASIRKIISEDQPAEGAKPAAKPQAVRPPPAPEPPAMPAPRPELDVLDLTDEVKDDEPVPEAPVAKPAPPVAKPAPPPAPTIRPPAPVIDNDVIFQNIEPAKSRASSNLNGQEANVSYKPGSIEATFAEAVQQGFRPALKEWISEHSNDVAEQLRPMIQAWMDEHLPPLIEAAVLKEISRAFTRKREL
jgi:cell pole-organizing protein PopZ